jgi:hypothetical protein
MERDRIIALVSLVIEKHGIRAPSVAQLRSIEHQGKDADEAELWAEVARQADATLKAELD